MNEPASMPSARQLALAALVGLVCSLWLFPIDFLIGTSDFWASPYGDITPGRTGLRYYLWDEWHWPLLWTERAADGLSIYRTDSLPLLAVPLKIAAPILGPQVHGFGIWVWIATILQPVTALYLAHRVGVRRPATLVAAVFLSLAAVPWLTRLGHPALFGHWMLIWAVAESVGAPDSNRGSFSRLGVLTVCVSAVHGYLLFMVGGLLGAAFLDRLRTRVDMRATVAIFAASLGGVGCALLAQGVFVDPSRPPGFGHLKINPAALFIPRDSWLFETPAWGLPFSSSRTYLGLGLVLLLVAMAVPALRGLRLAQRHAVVVLALFVLFVVSLGDPICIGSLCTAKLDVDLPVLEQLRATDRMWWPVYYGGVAVALRLLEKTTPPRSLAPILAVLVLAQWADVTPSRQRMSLSASAPDLPKLRANSWEDFIGRHGSIHIVPQFYCAGDVRHEVATLAFLASATGTPTNTLKTARGPMNMRCVDEPNPPVEEDVLRIYMTGTAPGEEERETWCRSFDYGVACSHRWDTETTAGFRPWVRLVPPYTLGERVEFGRSGGELPYLGKGWSRPSPWGRWTDGDRARLRLALSEPHDGPMELRIALVGFASERPLGQHVVIRVNGAPVALWSSWRNGLVVQTATIPAGLIGADGVLEIDLYIEFPARPMDVREGSRDPRRLGFGVHWMEIQPVRSRPGILQ